VGPVNLERMDRTEATARPESTDQTGLPARLGRGASKAARDRLVLKESPESTEFLERTALVVLLGLPGLAVLPEPMEPLA